MQNFQELKLNPSLNASLIKMKFDTPTPIQIKSIPLILEKKDILASAQTGTGKTAAFCIPMIELIAQKKTKKAIILVPTRELAKQVNDVIEKLLFQQSIIKSVCLVGGEPMNKQLKRLKSGPQIIVGTPGRVNDHLKRKSLILHHVDLLILDEMDRMLDMGFSIQIDEIIKFLPKEKQTLMFSATIAPSIERLSTKYLNNAERVSVAPPNATVVTIKQEVVQVRQEDKYNTLVEHVRKNTGSTLVFMKTKHNAKKLAKNLSKEGFESDSLHGNLRQNKRNQVIAKFRANKIHVLVATDIAARGLDIPHIEHVINYDLTQQAEDFIQRMGRTVRAGALGTAWSYVTPNDKKKWREIEKILNPGLKPASDKRSDNSFGRRDSSSKRNSFKSSNDRRGGGFRDRKKEKFSFRDKPKRSFEKRPETFVEEPVRSFKKSKPKNEGYGRKNKASFDDRKPNRFANERKPSNFSNDRKPSNFSSDRKPNKFAKDRRPNQFSRDGENKFRSGAKEGFKAKSKSSNYGKKSSSFIGDNAKSDHRDRKSPGKFGFKKRFASGNRDGFRSRNKTGSKKKFSPTLN